MAGVDHPVKKRSISISGHNTSITLEDAFWQGLKEIATSKGLSVQKLIEEIDAQRQTNNLSSEIRVYVLRYFQHLHGK